MLPAVACLAASGAKLKLEAIPLDSHNFEARLASGQSPERGAQRPSEETASGADRRISFSAAHRLHGFGDRTLGAPDGAGSHRGRGREGPRAAAPAELYCRRTGRGRNRWRRNLARQPGDVDQRPIATRNIPTAREDATDCRHPVLAREIPSGSRPSLAAPDLLWLIWWLCLNVKTRDTVPAKEPRSGPRASVRADSPRECGPRRRPSSSPGFRGRC